MTTILNFSKQCTSFSVESNKKTIKVRAAKPRDSKSKTKFAPSYVNV